MNLLRLEMLNFGIIQLFLYILKWAVIK